MKKLSLEEMENLHAGGMSCKVALLVYGFSFIGLCAATGGLAVTAAVVSFGASIYDAIEACKYSN